MATDEHAQELATACEPRARSGTEGERTRREAIARVLCARICDEQRTCDELELLSVVLSQIETAKTTPLLQQLENDRFNLDEDDGSLYRHGWNHAVYHATALIRINHGLSELRRQSQWPDDEPLQCCPRFTWGDGTHDLSCKHGELG